MSVYTTIRAETLPPREPRRESLINIKQCLYAFYINNIQSSEYVPRSIYAVILKINRYFVLFRKKTNPVPD